MRPTQEQVDASRPAGAPAHAWPRFADYERFPDMIGKPPAWWGWFKLEVYADWPRGRVVEVTGRSYRPVPPRPWDEGAPSVQREVMTGTREAAAAAYRLLAEASPCASETTGEKP
jgi:ketosteroid isomerase-like protein